MRARVPSVRLPVLTNRTKLALLILAGVLAVPWWLAYFFWVVGACGVATLMPRVP